MLYVMYAHVCVMLYVCMYVCLCVREWVSMLVCEWVRATVSDVSVCVCVCPQLCLSQCLRPYMITCICFLDQRCCTQRLCLCLVSREKAGRVGV